jgi:hypothetical protein
MAVINRIKTSAGNKHFYKIHYNWLNASDPDNSERLHDVEVSIVIRGTEDLETYAPFVVDQVVIDPVGTPPGQFLTYAAHGGTAGCMYDVIFRVTTTWSQVQADCVSYEIVGTCES